MTAASRFYANASEAKKSGASVFEKRPVEFGIRQIRAGVRHPQTNGRMERLHGKIQCKLPEFEAIVMGKSAPVGFSWNGATTGGRTCLLTWTGKRILRPRHSHAGYLPKEKSWLTNRQEMDAVLNGDETTFRVPLTVTWSNCRRYAAK